MRNHQLGEVSKMKNGYKWRKSDEWDSREREWTREMRNRMQGTRRQLKQKEKKFDPRKRFRFMLVCLGIFLVSIFALWLTSLIPWATDQAIFSIFSTIISGIVFVVNYGKDILITILNSVSKNSLR